MATPKHASAVVCSLILLAGSIIALSACAVGATIDEPQIVDYHQRSEYGFVRRERIEPGAPDNTHPHRISETTLRQVLGSLKAQGVVQGNGAPIFDNDELAEIVAPLAAALAAAGPNEDVTFAVPGAHGRFGKRSPRTVTTGRVFVHDGKLHLVFGLVHEPFERQLWDTGYLPAFTPGSRKAQLDAFAKILPGSARLADKRTDWVIVGTMPKAPESSTSSSPGSVSTDTPAAEDRRYADVERELDALDRLKADGEITDAEYKERRRAILRGGSGRR